MGKHIGSLDLRTYLRMKNPTDIELQDAPDIPETAESSIFSEQTLVKRLCFYAASTDK